MNRKFIVWGLVWLGGINLFLFLSGIAIPVLISTDKLPLMGIVFIITTIVFFIVTMGTVILNKYLTKPKRKRK